MYKMSIDVSRDIRLTRLSREYADAISVASAAVRLIIIYDPAMHAV